MKRAHSLPSQSESEFMLKRLAEINLEMGDLPKLIETSPMLQQFAKHRVPEVERERQFSELEAKIRHDGAQLNASLDALCTKPFPTRAQLHMWARVTNPLSVLT